MSGQHVGSSGHRLDRAVANSSPVSPFVWARRVTLMAAATLFAIPETANAQHVWNWGPADYYYRDRYYRDQYYRDQYYRDQRPVRPKRAKIKRKADPAETAAKAAAKPVGPLVIAVSVEKQRLKVYDSNGLFAEAPVSTGTKSHPTPYGVFSIIQKNRHHVSNIYGAPMPYMQRITWSGVALHKGPLPGYAASHGCIRLPDQLAARLWTWTKMGTRVIVAPGEVSPADFSHPKLVSRMVPTTVSTARAAAADAARSKSDRMAMAQQRTADARETTVGIKGTLSDAALPPSAESRPAETEIPQAQAAEASSGSKDAGLGTPSDTVVAQFANAKNEAIAETKVAHVAEKPVEAAADDASSRTNADERGKADVTAEPTVSKREEKSFESKAADAARADVERAAAAQKLTKPADIVAPVATPEPTKSAVVATRRRHNHVAVFISRKDKKLYVRQGYEPVFDTPVDIADADRPLGTHVFTARGDKDDASALRWSVVSLPQVARRSASKRLSRRGTKAAPVSVQSAVIAPPNASDALDRITISDEAMEKIASIITPGGSLLISDHGLNGWETGKGTDFIVPLR